MTQVHIAGVGMTAFGKPGKSPNYVALGSEAIRLALADAGVAYDAVEQVYAGYVYGDSCAGHRVAYEVGMSGVPIFNVNSNCSTGSSALFLARQAVESGAAECVLAVGFEQMAPGALSEKWPDRPTPLEKFIDIAVGHYGIAPETPMALALFASAGREYREKYDIDHAHFANALGEIAVKARRHAAHNPNAVFRDPITVDEVVNGTMFCDPITRLCACPPTCGGAAALVVSEAFARKHGLSNSVRIRAQALTTDRADTFTPPSGMHAVGFGMSARAAQNVYAASGVEPSDIRVVELHDCFTVNELISYEALGLTAPGTALDFIARGDNTYGGRVVVNPSGGLLSKGHPLGATGLAQCFELVSQLRGRAGARQVEGARLGLQHNIGLGGACVVTLYEA